MIKSWMPLSDHVELYRCQQHCYAIILCSGSERACVSEGMAISTTSVQSQLNLPVPLRTGPTLTVSPLSGLCASDFTNEWTVATMSITSTTTRFDQFRIAVTGSGTPFTQFRPYFVFGYASGSVSVLLDAGL